MSTGIVRTVILNGKQVSYHLLISPRARRLRLTMTESGLIVTLPKGIAQREVEPFLQQNAEWVLAGLTRLERNKARAQKNALPRDVILLRGKPVKITPVVDPARKNRVALENIGGHLKVHLPPGAESHLAEAVENGLRQMARSVIEQEVVVQARRMKLAPRSVSIRDQRTRWGSCSSKGTLSFNWRLLMAPPEILEYVVVHELAHLQQANHSPAFWKIVSQYYPAYKEARSWLRKNGHLLHPQLT